MLMSTPDQFLKTLFSYAATLARPLLRISLGLTLLWIGCVDLLDPRVVVGLLSASLPFLAFNQFVYGLKVLEIAAGVLLLAGLWVRYVALLSLALFAGTLTIFVIAPSVTGFPVLTLTGQFLLKDTVLASAAITLIGWDAATHKPRLPKLKSLFSFGERIAGMLLRISLGVVLFWIGCVHLIDPQPDVALLSMSLPFLAFTVFVYLLGALEVLAGIMLLAGLWIRYVALLSLAVYAGTLTIFVVAPGVTGFPLLTLMGQFILKDTVLASATIALAARDAASHEARLTRRRQPPNRSGGPDIERAAA
jgi:uncharacterized membrane protein YkgB